MLTADQQFRIAVEDLERAEGLSDYEAVDVAWVAIVKLANLETGDSEHKRMLALCQRLKADAVGALMANPAVDQLLDLQPPLESIVTTALERLDEQKTKQQLEAIRSTRATDPRGALLSLVEVLKRIRNRRAHGFKAPDGPRDVVILQAAVTLLLALGAAAIAVG